MTQPSPTPPARSRGVTWAIALLALTAVVFGRVCGHEFVNLDDQIFLTGNSAIVSPTLSSLAEQWRQPVAHLYMPVTMTAWWLVAHAASVRDAAGAAALNPWVFHAASLIVHLVNVLLVWQVVRRIVGSGPRATGAAAIGAAIFAIHPLQVETVAWASEMKDLLAAGFALAAIVAVIEACSRRRAMWIATAVVCYSLALLSKPSAVTAPLVAAAALWAMAKSPRAWMTVLLVGLAMALPMMIVTRLTQSAPDLAPPTLLTRPLVAADALAFYLGKLIWPAKMAADYGRTPPAIVASGAIRWTWLVPVFVTVVTVVAVVAVRRGNRVLLATWVVFVAGCATNLGLVPFDFQAYSTVADHYVYLSMLGVAIGVAWVASRWPRSAMAMTAVIAVLAVLAFRQAGTWRDAPTLWWQALAVNPRSLLALGNVGAYLIDQNDPAAAIKYLDQSAAIEPDEPFVHLNLTRARLALGNTAGAAESALTLVAVYERRKTFNPQLSAAVLDKFASAIAARGDAASAAKLTERADRLRQAR